MALKDTDGRSQAGRWRKFEGAAVVGRIEPPAGYRVVQIDTPSCEALRDVVSLRWDLESAAIFCDAFVATEDTDAPKQRPASEALWVAAVVSYGRAFATGVRHAERLNVTTLTDEEREAHGYFIDVRNKHVAHSVNSMEQVITLAYLTDSVFEPRRATRVGQSHVSVNPMTTQGAEMLRALARKFVRQLDLRVRELHEAPQVLCRSYTGCGSRLRAA